MVGIDFGKPLFTSEEIQRKIHELGSRISSDYADKDILVIGVLKGALFFMSDLLRSMRISVRMDFIHCTSSSSKGKGVDPVKIICDIKEDIRGMHVLLVEDIMDSGVTLKYLRQMLQYREPASLKVCVLLDKADRRQTEVEVGLDYKDRYRNLPYIAVLPLEEKQ
jgi:hypoxanthine phosphoribosyltransferase